MNSVAIFSLKGGVGRTTLAAHLVRRAQAQDIQTIAVSLDRMGNLDSWLCQGRRTNPTEAVECGKHLTAIHSPDRIPQLRDDASLVVYDFPPDLELTAGVKPDLWIVPTMPGRASAELLGPMLGELTTSGAEIWLVTRSGHTSVSVSALRDAVSKFPNVQVSDHVIPESDAIYLAAENFSVAWESRPQGEGAKVLARLCDDILKHLGVVPVA